MDITKSKFPSQLDRDVEIHLSREEIIAILLEFISKKTDMKKFTYKELSCVVSSDDKKLSGMSIIGKETVDVSVQQNS